jgi:hypothetical protein
VPPTVWFAPDTDALATGPARSPAMWILDLLTREYAQPSGTRTVLTDEHPDKPLSDRRATAVEPQSDLTVLALHAGSENPDASAGHSLDPAHLAARILIALRTVRLGGILAVRAPDPTPGPGFHDTTGQIITAAHNAGLEYLQHIVAVHATLHGTRIIPTAARPLLEDLAAAHKHHAPVHPRIHTDYLIFTVPNGAHRA